MNEFKNQIKRDAKNEKEEDLFKAKIMFDGMEFLIYDSFEYNGQKYYYIIEDKSKEFKSEDDLTKFFEDKTEKIRIEFIFEANKEKHLYETVIDKELLKALNEEETKRILAGKV